MLVPYATAYMYVLLLLWLTNKFHSLSLEQVQRVIYHHGISYYRTLVNLISVLRSSD